MKFKNFEELLVHEVRDLYDAEQQIAKALPKMIKAADAADLKAAFEKHLEETKGHIGRLEQVFQALGETPKGQTCKGIKGLLDEGDEIIAEKGDPATKDAGLIVAAQKVEHYEIASYGALRTWVQLLGHDRLVETVERTLNEEKEADRTLNEIAMRSINKVAVQHLSQ